MTGSDDEQPLTPAQTRMVARVRWLMLMSGFATVLGIAVVLGVVGYRMFRSAGTTSRPNSRIELRTRSLGMPPISWLVQKMS